MEKTTLIFIGIVACLVSIASAKAGIATFYTKYLLHASETSPKVTWSPQPVMQWKNGKVCGKKFTVKCTGARNAVPHPCTGKSVTVRMVDRCPGCPSTIDLSKEAFAHIANPVAGIINIDYKEYE
ncbi:hypothetical protein V6N11_047722 [Hibiscus sabdariffa]|uniref:Uncharacterized protein n=2 Tax=Hibiscus sabdariffa TaxID=183260 RepID=A0ABR2BA89_9ROSI